LDVSSSAEPATTYYARVPDENRLLACEFGDVLNDVLGALGRLTGRQVVTDPNLALPGFHIFWGTSLVDTPTDRMNHFDIQYRALRWVGSWGPEPPRSFTVPIVLPAGGSSLDCWPIRYGDVDPSPHAHPQAACSLEHGTTIWYELGKMLVHTDLWLHRIGRSNSRGPRDYRITLQGHLLEVNGNMVAYW
jgi:hypothetical protein